MFCKICGNEETQERIANAKGVARPTVTWRLQLNDEMSDEVKENVRQGLIDEGHLHEILELFVDEHLSLWLSTEEARQELICQTINHIQKNGNKSTKAVREDVSSMKTLIDKVEKTYKSFDDPEIFYVFEEKDGKTTVKQTTYNARKEFLTELNKNKVRTLADITFYSQKIKDKLSENIAKYKKYIEGKSNDKEQESEKDRKFSELKNKFLNDDGIESLNHLKDASIRLLLVDPPYGANYQSNRRWKSEKRDKIIGDYEEEALKLVDELLKRIKKKLMGDAHLLIFTNSKQLCSIRSLLTLNKYDLKGELIWVKDEHGTGDLKGTFAPQHEYIVHATQGRPNVTPRHSTVFNVAREGGANPKTHPTKKPIQLLSSLIQSTTSKGELVVDPFAGVASTLHAALLNERDFWGCEIDEKYWKTGMDALFSAIEKKI